MFESTKLCSINWQKRYFAAISCYFTKYSFTFTIGEHLNHTCLMIFLAVSSYGKLSAQFLASRLRLIEMVGFMSLF